MPLRCLFVDMNSFFASVEQEDRPELRGRAVAVAPLLAETTCCIAASYEAKRRGVRTGTPVHEARRLCPGIHVLEARPHRYVTVHRQMVAAVESCLPVSTVMSIDEVACRLTGGEQQPDGALRLAKRVKAAIADTVGQQLRCSVGVAPNTLLAKVAADAQKPDGLTVIRSEDLPGWLYRLQLGDFPGIGRRMEQRLHHRGILTVQQLCELSREQLASVWGSPVVAERWWRRLRGEDVSDPPTRRGTLGHSHVLPPQRRNDTDAYAILVGLLHKAAARLRAVNYWACSLSVAVAFTNGHSWQECRDFDASRDTLTLLQILGPLWRRKPAGVLVRVGVTLGGLVSERNTSLPLFAEDRRLLALADAMDRINDRFGAHAVYFGGMHREGAGPATRIAFTNVPDL